MKKNKRYVAAFVALLVLIPVGTTIAYFRAETSSSNKLTSGNIGIALMDATNDTQTSISDKTIHFASKYPGAVMDKNTYVKNTKDFPLYVRVKVTKYWKDATDKKVKGADASLIETITADTSNWIVKKDDRNQEVEYYYYRFPLAKGDQSDNFIDQIRLSGKINGQENIDYGNSEIYIDFQADAVQKLGAQQAILAEWGLDVSIDENGKMNEIEN